jgi:hypothetical protein
MGTWPLDGVRSRLLLRTTLQQETRQWGKGTQKARLKIRGSAPNEVNKGDSKDSKDSLPGQHVRREKGVADPGARSGAGLEPGTPSKKSP